MKPNFTKFNFKGSCWYCSNRAIGFLTFKDGSEIKICWGCARKRSKIRRIRKDKGKLRVRPKKEILGNTYIGKSNKKTIQEVLI